MYSTKWSGRELAFEQDIQRGARGAPARRVQEWLSLNGHPTTVDGDFGGGTERAVRSFQSAAGIGASGVVTRATWERLVAPLAKALETQPSSGSIQQAVLAVAQAPLAQKPREVGGPNAGPWVRLYMNGNEGPEWAWCAGFVCFVMAQACSRLGISVPVKPTFSCDSLAAHAKAAGLFVAGRDIESGKRPTSELGEVCLFLCRRTDDDWTHVGFAYDFDRSLAFATLEGNTNDEGSREGYEVCCRSRSVAAKDFIRLA
jgi:hypothetical protein